MNYVISNISEGAIPGADETIRKHYPRMRSLLVVQDGKLLAENYYGNCDCSSLHDLRSATKSVLSMLLGIADMKGQLPGLDIPLWDSIKEHAPERPDPAWIELTLRDLLTMRAGIYWQTGPKLGERFIHRLHRSRSWVDFIMRLPIMPELRGTFQYCSAASHLLSVLLTKWTGATAHDYAAQYLFQPLHFADVRWDASPEGHSSGHIGLHLTSRDMLKLGLLCLHKGQWERQKIISEDWLQQSTLPHCPPFHNYGQYGFHWWSSASKGVSYSYAHGHGGQQIHVIPELKAVVIFTAESDVRRFRNPKELLESLILPALQNN